MWVNPNNHDIMGNKGFEGLCHWCSDCNATTTLIEEEDINRQAQCHENAIECMHKIEDEVLTQ